MIRREFAEGLRVLPIPKCESPPGASWRANFDNDDIAGQRDNNIAELALRLQARRIVERYGFAPALAVVIASHAFGFRA